MPGIDPIILASPTCQLDGLFATSGSPDWPGYQMVHQRDSDVVQQKAADRFVDPTIRSQRAGEAQPTGRRSRHPSPPSFPRSLRKVAPPHRHGSRYDRCDAAHDQGSFAADDDQAEPRRQRRAQPSEHGKALHKLKSVLPRRQLPEMRHDKWTRDVRRDWRRIASRGLQTAPSTRERSPQAGNRCCFAAARQFPANTAMQRR